MGVGSAPERDNQAMYNTSILIDFRPLWRKPGWQMSEETQPPQDEQVDLLVVIILAPEQVGELSNKLVQNGYRFTLVNTSGGVFESGAIFMLVGIPRQKNDDLLGIIKAVCHTRVRFVPTGESFAIPGGLPPIMIQAEVGSAFVYTLDVDHYEYF